MTAHNRTLPHLSAHGLQVLPVTSLDRAWVFMAAQETNYNAKDRLWLNVSAHDRQLLPITAHYLPCPHMASKNCPWLHLLRMWIKGSPWYKLLRQRSLMINHVNTWPPMTVQNRTLPSLTAHDRHWPHMASKYPPRPFSTAFESFLAAHESSRSAMRITTYDRL